MANTERTSNTPDRQKITNNGIGRRRGLLLMTAALFSALAPRGRIAHAQLGGVGGSGDPPSTNEPPPSLGEPAGFTYRDIEFLGKYDGNDSEGETVEEATAKAKVKELFLIAAAANPVFAEAAKGLNKLMARQVNPAQNVDNNYHLTRLYGPKGWLGSAQIGVIVAPDHYIDNNKPLTVIHRVNNTVTKDSSKVLPAYTELLVVGRYLGEFPSKDIGFLSENILYPFNRINEDLQKFDELLNKGKGEIPLSDLEKIVDDPNSGLNREAKGEAWKLTLDAVSVLIDSQSDWNMNPAFRDYYAGYKQRIEEGDQPKLLEYLTDFQYNSK